MTRARSFLVAFCSFLLLVQSSTAFLLLPPSHQQNLAQQHHSPSSLLLLAQSESIDYDKDYSTTTTTTAMEDDPDTDDYHATVATTSASEKDSIPSEIATSASVLDEDGMAATKKTVIYGIRHGVSVSNEWISLPENTWGAPTFNDDNGNPRDARLSIAGERQAAALAESLLADPPAWLDDVELVVVSPLTRCLQTFQLAVQPALQTVVGNKDVPVLAHPWATERVYTISETGRSARELRNEFPSVDFALCPAEDTPWWYDPQCLTEFNRDISWKEWRPHAEGQRYGAAGEPKKVFQRRMDAFQRWLEERPEQTIFVTAHWGVFRHYLEGQELDNCQVCRFDLSSRNKRNQV